MNSRREHGLHHGRILHFGISTPASNPGGNCPPTRIRITSLSAYFYEPRNIQSGSWARSKIESIAGITPVVAFPFSNFAIPGNVTIDEAMITYEGFVTTPQHMSCLIRGEKRPKRHIHQPNNFLLLSCSCRVSRSQIRSLEGWGSGRRCHPWSRAGRAASASTPEEGAAGASPRPGRTEGPWSHSTRPTAARSASCRTGRPFPQVREHRSPITLVGSPC